MTKAPVDNLNEQSKNLRDIHKSFLTYKEQVGDYGDKDSLKKTMITLDDKDYFEKMFRGDFNFDPKLSWIIGNFVRIT